GTAPFAGSTVPEIFYRVVHEEPKLDGLDPGLRDVVAAALDKDPRRRPSVQEVLGRLVGNGTTDPATLAETVQAGWHGVPAGAAGGPGAHAAAAPTVLQHGADTTRRDARPGSRPGGGLPRRPLLIGGAAAAAVV